jgi:hypothetical protein
VARVDYWKTASVEVDTLSFPWNHCLPCAISHLTVLNTAERKLAETGSPVAWQNPRTFGDAEALSLTNIPWNIQMGGRKHLIT